MLGSDQMGLFLIVSESGNRQPGRPCGRSKIGAIHHNWRQSHMTSIQTYMCMVSKIFIWHTEWYVTHPRDATPTRCTSSLHVCVSILSKDKQPLPNMYKTYWSVPLIFIKLRLKTIVWTWIISLNFYLTLAPQSYMEWQQLTDGQKFPLEVLNLVSFHHNAEQLWISEIFVGNEETQIK